MLSFVWKRLQALQEWRTKLDTDTIGKIYSQTEIIKAELGADKQKIDFQTDANIRLQEAMLSMRMQEEKYRKELETEIISLQNDLNFRNRIAEDLHRRFEDVSPFALPIAKAWPMLLQEYLTRRAPLLLVAPFWDETQGNAAHDAGGGQFRLAVADALRNGGCEGDFTILDGYFKRPLRQADMDLKIIQDALGKVPVIVVYGTLSQREVRCDVAMWNVLPSDVPGQRVTLRGSTGQLSREVALQNNREFQSELGRDLSAAISQAGAIHRLFQSGEHPDVKRFLTGEPERNREIAERLNEYVLLYKVMHFDGPRAAASTGEAPLLDARPEPPLLEPSPPPSNVTLLAQPHLPNSEPTPQVRNMVPADSLEGANPMSSGSITEVIGFDFGDSESALSRISTIDASAAPNEIFSNLANNQTGIIKTVVGYRSDGRVLIGEAAATCRDLAPGGLHVGFKSIPTRDNKKYAGLAKDFIDQLFTGLRDEKLFSTDSSKFVIGYPCKWKNIRSGEPVQVLREVVAGTALGSAVHFELVPESRGAMVEALQARLFSNSQAARSGWSLVIDLGSSTVDFTAVNLKDRRNDPADLGEELGARLIDRAIVENAISCVDDRQKVEQAFRDHPEERARFELACRGYKEAYFSSTEGTEVVTAYRIVPKGAPNIFVPIELNRENMGELISRAPIVEIDGNRLSWEDGFRETLRQAKAEFQRKGITKIGTILLTGGASRMNFVQHVCEEVFPDLPGGIARAPNPQFTIANGLARWGRLQIQTDAFARDIAEFCTTTVRQVVDGKVTKLLQTLAACRTEFCDWGSSGFFALRRRWAPERAWWAF